MPIPPPVRSTGETYDGSIFDKLIEDYDALAERAEDMVFQHVCGEIEMELRAHFFRHAHLLSGPGLILISLAVTGRNPRLDRSTTTK